MTFLKGSLFKSVVFLMSLVNRRAKDVLCIIEKSVWSAFTNPKSFSTILLMVCFRVYLQTIHLALFD